MREYGQIQCAFWTDPEIQSLSDQGKILAAYLLTGPHSNGIGCYRLPDGYINADLGWDSGTVSKGFRELFENGFAYRCQDTFLVLIPAFLKWNPIQNPNSAKARAKEIQATPKKTQIFNDLLKSMERYGNHWPNGYLNGIERVPEGLPDNLTRPEPNQNHITPSKPPPEKSAWELRSWMNPQAWAEFEQHRREMKQPLTDMARTKAASQLKELTFQQQQEVIDMTIQNRWRGLFPDKRTNNHGNHKPQTAVERVEASCAARRAADADASTHGQTLEQDD